MGKSDKKEKEAKLAANLEKFEKMSAELDKEKKKKKKKSKDRKREHTPEKEVGFTSKKISRKYHRL